MKNYKNILIYGYSASGKAVEKILINNDANYKIFDDNMRLGGGKYIFNLTKREIAKFDLIIISPAVSIFNKHIVFAESIGIRVISELEFGYLFCPFKIIAVTGTNGKTTTVSLIEHVLNNCGFKAKALGNIGEPLSAVVNYSDLDYVVAEVSSFQLEATYKFTPYIGIILNIDADHLNRHKTLNNYINLKISMFKNCNGKQTAILNDEHNILNNLNSINANALFLHRDVKEFNGKIYYKNEEVCEVGKLENFTYLDNVLSAIAVFKLLNINNENIVSAINSFNKPKHRMEFVNLINNVEYINDSKATNPHATLAAVAKINKEIVLLLGGKDKNFNFFELIKNLPQNVKKIIAFGEVKKSIYKAAKKQNRAVIIANNLSSATIAAKQIATSGQVVLLSPACASFDEFLSYEERGNKFKTIVNNWLINEQPQVNSARGEIC